jgi:DNA topoisomerase-1
MDSTASARVAGLRHVDPDLLPGIRRVGSPRRFAYVDARGRPVRDRRVLDRIRKLAIPPAWTAVWICALERGHVQAVGRDARGRKQYRYHARWREVRDAAKFDRLLTFAEALPRIRAACDSDLARPGLPRAKVLATAVRLLETTFIRIGHEEYTRDNGSYGLTTLRNRHVRVLGAEIRFRFRGKSGQLRDVGVHDRRLARIVTACTELPGQELFQWVDDDRRAHAIDSTSVNEYIARVAGGDFTAKDFRTWAGTVLAASALHGVGSGRGPVPARKLVTACIKQVAARLGNTPAVCRRCYVHPAVIEAFTDGWLARVRARDGERRVVAVLQRARRGGQP